MDSAAAPFPATRPKTTLPAGSWDAHVHLLGGPHHPLSPTRVENPPHGLDFEGWLSLYRTHLAALGCARGLIVHSILYGTDNTVTLEAVREMGAGFKGVGLLPDGADASDIRHFARNSIVAVRLNYVHGGVLTWDGAKAMAGALADQGMHIQMLLHADKHIEELAEDIRGLPVPLVIDHCGWPTTLDARTPAIDTLCDLLADGHIHVKLSAPYRLSNEIARTSALMQRLIHANPERCMWGSDWPHIMLNDAKMPRAAELLDHVAALVPSSAHAQVFRDTAQSLFDPV